VPDPACGLAGYLTVIDHTASNQTFIPGDSEHGRVFSGTIAYGDVWAVRNYFSTSTSYVSATLRPSETGEDSANYTIVVSRIPGGFDQTKDENDETMPIPGVCVKTGELSASSSITVSSRIRSLASIYECPMDANSMYYVNIKAVSTGCGSSLECRLQTKATWPH
jgi:hypothetical protein